MYLLRDRTVRTPPLGKSSIVFVPQPMVCDKPYSGVPVMKRFSQGKRSLYLLALFQLVGGPAVLLAIMMFSKIAVKTFSAEAGTKAGFTKIFQSTEWQSFALTLDQTVNADGKSKTPFQPQAKNAKLKIVSVPWSPPQILPFVFFEVQPHCRWVPDESSAWPHAPPSPPPKLA